MELLILALSIICILAGVAGAFIPVLPGPTLAWTGIFIASFSKYLDFSTNFLLVTGIITLIITVLDFFLPSIYVKKKGASKAGSRGALVGTFIGLFFGPIGIILGPMIGALFAETVIQKTPFNQAILLSFHVLIGFLLSTGIKLIWGLFILWWWISAFF